MIASVRTPNTIPAGQSRTQAARGSPFVGFMRRSLQRLGGSSTREAAKRWAVALPERRTSPRLWRPKARRSVELILLRGGERRRSSIRNGAVAIDEVGA